MPGGGVLSSVMDPVSGAAVTQFALTTMDSAITVLEARERSRVEVTLASASQQIHDGLGEGQQVRLEVADPENPDAATLFEAVVEAAAKGNEDRKCQVIANLYASIALDGTVSVSVRRVAQK